MCMVMAAYVYAIKMHVIIFVLGCCFLLSIFFPISIKSKLYVWLGGTPFACCIVKNTPKTASKLHILLFEELYIYAVFMHSYVSISYRNPLFYYTVLKIYNYRKVA